MPFVILDSAHEALVDLNQTKLMAQLILDAELKTMPDTGHFAVFELLEEFNRLVLAYLNAWSSG